MSLSRTLLASGLAVASLGLGPVALAAAPAVAAPARPMPANATDDCLSQGRIWLVVQDSKGNLMHNQCVEVGKTGQALLDEAGVKTTKDAKGFICAMDGEPAKCPAKFDGNYWQYYTATKGGKWTYATKGADQSKPVAGTLEGWCYGSKCTPAMPALDAAGSSASSDASSTASAGSTASASSSGSDAAASSSPAATTSAAPTSDSSKSSTPWGIIVAALVVAALALAGYLASRRRKA